MGRLRATPTAAGLLLIGIAACAHAPGGQETAPAPVARRAAPQVENLPLEPIVRPSNPSVRPDPLEGAPALAAIKPALRTSRRRKAPRRARMERSLARLSEVLGSLRAAREPGPLPRAPQTVVAQWDQVLESLDGYLDQPPRNTPAMELVRAKVTVETELEADSGAWVLPGELTERVRSRLAYLDHRIELARARLLPVPAGAPVRLAWPVDPVIVNSDFGWRRDPIHRRGRFHHGIDLDGERGQLVTAAAAGTITWSGWNGGHGRHLEVVHPGGWVTRYSHLQAMMVERGDQVGQGDIIGLMGATGRVTGVHLHFEVWRWGDAVDPSEACGDTALVSEAVPGAGMGGW